MLKDVPSEPPAPRQCSWSTQPSRVRVTLFVPATLPLPALVTSHSPVQKSNCRYSGESQRGGAAAAAAGGGVPGAGGPGAGAVAKTVDRAPPSIQVRDASESVETDRNEKS